MSTFRAIVASSFLIFAPAHTLASVPVAVNIPESDLVFDNSSPRVSARFRFDVSAGGFDQIIFQHPNVANNVNRTRTRLDLINGRYVGSATFNFVVRHTALNDTWEFTLDQGVATGNTVLQNSASPTLTRSFPNPVIAPFNYNILHVFLLTSSDGTSASLSNLTFTTGAGLTQTGTLETAGSSAFGINGNVYDQWLASPTGTDLGDFDWTFTGTVTLTIDSAIRPASESIKFEISAKEGLYIPAPAAAAVLTLGGLAAARRRR